MAEIHRALEQYNMVETTRAQANLAWAHNSQTNLTQPSPNHQQGQTLFDSTCINYQDSAFQDSQDPWPTIALETPSDNDSDNLSDQNMNADHEHICK